jgi:hypothetical protein
MSEIRLKRTNLLNNDSLEATTALTGFRPVLGEIATGGDVRGTDRDRAAEALRDREVERTKAGSGAINLTSSVFGGQAGGARAMILVNLFKVKGITAMFCSLTHAKPESAVTDVDVSCLTDIRLEVGSEGIRIGSARVAQEAFRQARAGRGRGHGRKQSLNKDAFQFGKQAT